MYHPALKMMALTINAKEFLTPVRLG